MADKQINPNLRKLAEWTCNPNLKTPNLDEILANKNPLVSDITEICKGFEEFMRGGSRSCIIPIEITDKYNPTKQQILDFSKKLIDYKDLNDFNPYTSNYLTALMHSSKDNEFLIDLTRLNENKILLNHLGFKLTNKKLEVIGDIGTQVGHASKNSKIIINGDVGNDVGYSAEVSKIYIRGEIRSIFIGPSSGTQIYQFENGGWNEVKENDK